MQGSPSNSSNPLNIHFFFFSKSLSSLASSITPLPRISEDNDPLGKNPSPPSNHPEIAILGSWSRKRRHVCGCFEGVNAPAISLVHWDIYLYGIGKEKEVRKQGKSTSADMKDEIKSWVHALDSLEHLETKCLKHLHLFKRHSPRYPGELPSFSDTFILNLYAEGRGLVSSSGIRR